MPDTYSGDRAQLQNTFPGVNFDKNAHEHWAECGGHYWHAHRGGTVEHEHEHKRTDQCSTGPHEEE